jgi:hypothetical protein
VAESAESSADKEELVANVDAEEACPAAVATEPAAVVAELEALVADVEAPLAELAAAVAELAALVAEVAADVAAAWTAVTVASLVASPEPPAPLYTDIFSPCFV